MIAYIDSRAERVRAADIRYVGFQREDLEMCPGRHRLPERIVTGEGHDRERMRGTCFRVEIRGEPHGTWREPERYRGEDVSFQVIVAPGRDVHHGTRIGRVDPTCGGSQIVAIDAVGH